VVCDQRQGSYLVLDKIIVVGNGPSAEGKEDLINRHDIVIRLSNSIYRGRTDYFLYIIQEVDVLKQTDLSELKGFWFYRTQGRGKILSEEDWRRHEIPIRKYYKGEINHINIHIDGWLDIYKNIARPLNQRHHTHVTYPSKGTTAMLMAMATFKPNKISVVGMDKVLKGERTYHCHDFSAELKVLQEAERKLNCQICPL
jgi:hypothetical protein